MPLRPDPRPPAGRSRRSGRGSALPRRAALLGVPLLAALFAAGCGATLYPPDPVTVQGQDIHTLYNIVFIFAAVIFLAVEAAILYIVLRYRRQERDDILPEQTHGHTGVEILWTLIPFVIVAFLFLISWQALGKVVADPTQPAAVHVKVTAFQWCWKFEYVDAGVTATVPARNSKGVNCRDEDGNPPILVVPVGQRIRLQLHSVDVIHAFYVPQFLSKLDVIPQANEARDNIFDFTPVSVGEYRGQCAEFCGLAHAEMQFAVSVRSEADYQAWLTEQKNKPSPSAAASPPPGATTLQIAAVPVQKFDKTALEAPANQPFAIAFDNRDPGQEHDVSIQDAGGTLVLNGQPIVTGPGQATYVVDKGLAPGTYRFFCIVHPTVMFGTLEVH
jgi:cytochrome c oxidase subunit 2